MVFGFSRFAMVWMVKTDDPSINDAKQPPTKISLAIHMPAPINAERKERNEGRKTNQQGKNNNRRTIRKGFLLVLIHPTAIHCLSYDLIFIPILVCILSQQDIFLLQ